LIEAGRSNGMKIKICGITNLEDALAAVQAGADYLGFIFHPKSPRYVSVAQAQAIVGGVRRQYRDKRPKGVGVFVNASPAQVRYTLYTAGLHFAQLHGDEGPEAVAAQRGRAYKAVRPASRAEALEAAVQYAGLGPAPGPSLLLDAYHPTEYGGTGVRADWTAAAEVARRVPRLLLAGGLTPDNVAAAVGAVRPWGVDVSSGVEAAPGRKDHAKLRAFIRAALAVD
jgi:phosphoribosylanthranilate isomerase